MRTKRAMTWGTKAHLREVSCELGAACGGLWWLCLYKVPFVYVKDCHAKNRYYADDDGGDDDAHDDGHMPTVDSREHLSCNDAADDAVSDHQNGIKNGD